MTVRRTLAPFVAAMVVIASACSEDVGSVAIGDVTTSSSTTSVPAATSVPPATSTSTTTTSSTTTSTTSTTTTTTSTTTTAPGPPTMTSCSEVVHIGDSTSVPLFEASGVGAANLVLTARYQAVGVDNVYPDNDGARSIVERIDSGQANAAEVAQSVRDNGYRGCWVLMIGTNDAANIAAGSSTSAETRIRRMMEIIDGDPVLWIDTVTQRTDDAYRNASMLAWNQELYRVTAEYSNARVFRWYDVVDVNWFRSDGVHYTIEGSAQRAALTAQALVTAFPRAG